MKVEKVTELVPVTYWKCPTDGHRHKTKEVAERCADRAPRLGNTYNTWTPDMRRDVFISVLDGEAFSSVGRRYGVQGQRISQIFRRCLRIAYRAIRESGVVMPDHNWMNHVAEVRNNRDFWIAHADIAAK